VADEKFGTSGAVMLYSFFFFFFCIVASAGCGKLLVMRVGYVYVFVHFLSGGR
jgi:hypothetical protein